MRYKRVLISGVLLVSMFEEGKVIHAKCVKGLPSGTKFCYSFPYENYGIYIVVEHELFPELKNGDEIPLFVDRPEMEIIRTQENEE